MGSLDVRLARAAARERARRKIAEAMLTGRVRFRVTRDGAMLAYGPTGGRGKRIDFNKFIQLAEEHELQGVR